MSDMPGYFPCSPAEDNDFLAAAALLSMVIAAFVLAGDDIALFLNFLFINL